MNRRNGLPHSRVGVLYSGGLDSAALVAYYLEAGHEVWPVYVRSDLAWEALEIRCAQNFLREIARPSLRPLAFATLNLEHAYESNWSQTGKTPGADSRDAEVFLPARNLLLTVKSALLLSNRNVHDLAIATLKGNPFPDARPSYFRLLEKVFEGGFRHPVRIHAPFRTRTKAQIIRSLSAYPLHRSLSCIDPQGDLHCGRCNKCAERKKAFSEAGVLDLTVYAGQAPAGGKRLVGVRRSS
jgi:7-cyano-7-deazaguanine synthase